MLGLQNISFGASKGRVIPTGEKNIVVTSDGEVLTLPGQLIGGTTKVKPLKDGTYEIKFKPTLPNAQWRKTILTEEELKAKYGDKAGKKLQTVA